MLPDVAADRDLTMALRERITLASEPAVRKLSRWPVTRRPPS
jgi:hypothetical protein